MKTNYRKLIFTILIFGLSGFGNLYSLTPIDFSRFNSKSEISIKSAGVDLLCIEWKTSDAGRRAVTLNFATGASLLKSLQSDDLIGSLSNIANNLQPRFDVTIGERDTAKKWPYIFFDKVDLRPYKKITGELSINSVKIVSDGSSRANIIISKITTGSFR